MPTSRLRNWFIAGFRELNPAYRRPKFGIDDEYFHGLDSPRSARRKTLKLMRDPPILSPRDGSTPECSLLVDVLRALRVLRGQIAE
jgi:hypothetical protein